MASKNNPKKTETEIILSGILDPQELEVFAVRGKGCFVVFSNAKAADRFITSADAVCSCKANFARNLPGICDYCPHGGKNANGSANSFEITDLEGREYAVECNTANWFDGKPTTVYFLRDITLEKETKARLHALAYTDQLTGIPNRQRLKDDFAQFHEKIANNEVSGVVALFDLDNFKAINDTYGHNTGDLVLRRLAEYFQDIQIFSGHLYRLGGDEFVLLYYDQPGKFATENDTIEHYQALLSTALRAYTLPNIDLQCTLSIGVSLFPNHGKTLSEVLRKADIALYKAKAAGRNQIIFFESQYDAAQKFKDLYINIQPILSEVGKTYGYELVDRGNTGEADDNTVNLTEFNRTVDALGLTDIENNAQYFIMFSKQLLTPTVLMNLPKEKFIIQVQLADKLTRNELHGFLNLCVELRKNGYRLALVGLHSNTHTQELLSLADYCKFSPADINKMKQKRIISEHKKVEFIATNVDTLEAFQIAKDMGFSLFQGYYFSQPIVGQRTKEISPLKANYFRLLQLSSAEGYLDFREISSVIASDVALSYKLLRILNSAAVGLRNVSSIGIAVAYLGEENLKKWIAVLALSGIAEDKPLELVRMSLVRARFGELLAPLFRVKRDVKEVFLVGLLSLLHIALDMTTEKLFEEIAVAEGVRETLLTKRGPYSDLVRFYEHYEYANWDAVSQFVEENKIDPQDVNEAYIKAVKWYNDLIE